MDEPTEDQAKGGALAANGVETTHEHAHSIRDAKDAADSGNKFQQAVAAWRTLDLTQLVTKLDTAASELVDHQKDSLVQRKDLAQKTKDFRKLEDAVKLVEIKDLLKAYQTYIDILTTQSKSVSSAFMQAYSPLSEAPDPYPLLEASIDSLVTADEVVPKLEAENEHLQKQVSKLNNQLDDTEQELATERAKRHSFEGSQDAKITEVQESWAAVMKEKEENWTAKEHNLEDKIDDQDRLLKELKASYEVSQRLEKSGEDTQDAGRSTATAIELSIVNSELERSSVRLADLESRNEHLRVQLAQSTGHAHTSGRSAAGEDDPAYLRLRSENQYLMRKLDAVRYEKGAERHSIESRVRSVERECNMLKSDRDALQSKVQRWSDYDEVKRELEMLRAIEFATGDDAETTVGDDSSQTNGTVHAAQAQSLEQLLLGRNKKLSNDLTELRVSHNELLQRLETLQDELSTASTDLEKAQALNATLENDLQKTQQEAFNAFDTMSVAGTYTSRMPKSAYGSRRGGGGTSPTSSIIGGFDPSSGQGSPRGLDALRTGDPVGGGSGILPMVTAQRDRFKKKLGELEQELQKQYQTVSALRSEVASLQRDNLSLYEKTRYVSTYNRGGQPATSGASYGANPNPSTIQVGSSDTPSGLGIDRYRSAYEQNISPFAAFRGRESARALKRMSLPERAVFQITRMVLATRTSRNLFALYCLGLHLALTVMLYWMGTIDTGTHASNLGANTPAGAGGQVGGNWREEGFGSGA